MTEKPNVILPGTVEKIIKPSYPDEPEKAQIAIEGADLLYGEIRIENSLKDENGKEVRLKITGRCPRCVMTTLPQADLPADLGILRTAVKHNQAHVGVYASVLQGGTVRRGDEVRVE